jgi:aspartate/methionine/tyrosine aminotransferase
MSLKVNPPQQGDESFALYAKERDTIFESLKRRALKLSKFFNTLEGVTCNDAQGAMYLFPQVKLSKKAVAAAQAQGNKISK